MTVGSPGSDFEKNTLRRLKAIEDWEDRHRHGPGSAASGGGVNTPIFVPAIGGNWDETTDATWGQHLRVYGGGPYGSGGVGGLLEIDQVGISFQDGAYVSEFAHAVGIFTVPDGVNHFVAVPVMRADAANDDPIIFFFGEVFGMDNTGCFTATYAYGEATISRNVCVGEFTSTFAPQFVTAAQLESDAGAQEVIRIYAESGFGSRLQSSADSVVFVLGWQVYFTGPGVANPLGGQDVLQTAYNASTIALGTSNDSGWVDVDATNAAITFTPAMAGYYKATFIFPHYVSLDDAPNGALDISFRLTDGTTDGPNFIESFRPDTTYIAETIVNISYIFNWTVAAHTVKLQKYVYGSHSVLSNDLDSNSGPGFTSALYMSVERL